jgi:small-conductance mechanosensitive channel
MRKVNWLVVGTTGIILIWLFVGGSVMMAGWGTMNDWGYASTPSLLGWIRLAFIWLIPAVLIVLATFGFFWLARRIGKVRPPSS